MGFALTFGVMQVVVFLVFAVVLVGFVIQIVKGVGTWNRNNQSPRLTVSARIVSKRTQVTQHTHPNAGDATGAHGFHTTTSTSYYVTFEVESGDRMEFRVSGSEYGTYIEGDTGKLSFQGTRYLGFERE